MTQFFSELVKGMALFWNVMMTPPTCPPGLTAQGLQNCLDFIGPYPVAKRLASIAALIGVIIGVMVLRRWKP